MATWNIGMTWTPALALRLADILTEHGAGHLRPVTTLRKAAAVKSPALGQRAEQAYEAAGEELAGDSAWDDCRRDVGAILAEAAGLAGPEDQTDWIQATVIACAAELGLTAYAIAQRTEGRVSEDHVRDYLTRRKSMGSHKLQHVLGVLGLTIVPQRHSSPRRPG